jgi:diguanylate cyclase (GGDEF)-like protein
MSGLNYQEALQQLKQALYSHEQWHKDIIRFVACRLPYDKRDILADAHRQCRFGQWYYSTDSTIVKQAGGFPAIESEHKRMHEFACRLLLSSDRTGAVNPADYDSFSNSVDRLRLQMQSLIAELEDSLYKLDALTGAENRVGMLTALRQEQALILRDAHCSSIIIMDVDFFKVVNDTYGHVIGDNVLVELVRHTKSILRPYDRIFRYGGEEFLIFLPNTDAGAAVQVAERIREGLEGQTLAHSGDNPIQISASFGVAQMDQRFHVEDIIERADSALYAAKTAGRNAVRPWTE